MLDHAKGESHETLDSRARYYSDLSDAFPSDSGSFEEMGAGRVDSVKNRGVLVLLMLAIGHRGV